MANRSTMIENKLMLLRKILRKARSTLYHRALSPFAELMLEERKRLDARIAITVKAYNQNQQCDHKTLLDIRGEELNWPQRFERADRCYVAYAEGQAAACLWICFGEWRYTDNDPGTPLPEGAAFLYDAQTIERFQGKGIYQALLCHAAEDLANQGLDRVLLMYDQTNAAARKGPENAGFRQTSFYVSVHRILNFLTFRRINAPPSGVERDD